MYKTKEYVDWDEMGIPLGWDRDPTRMRPGSLPKFPMGYQTRSVIKIDQIVSLLNQNIKFNCLIPTDQETQFVQRVWINETLDDHTAITVIITTVTSVHFTSFSGD